MRDYFDSSAGTSYASFVDPCSFHDDDASTKGEKDSPALGRGESRIFHEVVNLIVGFFPCAKLDSPSSLTGVVSVAKCS